MVNVTGTVFVVAPVAATVIVPFKVPAARPAVFTFAVTVLLPEPEAGLTASQEALSLADQLRVPPPVFAIVRDWAIGFAPPTLPVKARLVGLSPMVGFVVDVVRVNVTGTHFLIPPPLITAIRW
jgi:hypothetical protein